MGVHERLIQAYNQKDDVAFDAVIQELLNDGAILPIDLQNHVDQWLASNQKQPSQVRWGWFPLGMVQRWIERAECAEAHDHHEAHDDKCLGDMGAY